MQVSEPTSALNAHAFPTNESRWSAVSWGAIIGGAFVSAALGLALLALGAGLEFVSVSPWVNAGASATAIGIATAIWLLAAQAISAGMGGYLAGRMRTKWVDVHNDEVFFRDTAHGFLVWAVGIVITGALLTSAATSLVAGTAKVAATGAAVAGLGAAGAAAGAAGTAPAPSVSASSPSALLAADPNAYYVDALFRSDRPAAEAADAPMRVEVGRIFETGLRDGDIAAADRAYISQMVAARTGLAPADADKRVAETISRAKTAASNAETKARQAADAARKAAAYASLWIFISLLSGAFCASYAATIGGRQRDRIAA